MGFVIWLIVSWSVLVVCALIAILLYTLTNSKNYKDWKEVLWTACGVLCIPLALSCLFSSIVTPVMSQEYNRCVTEIISISRESNVEGSFFIGSGSVREVNYYFYYYETDKGIKLGKTPADETYIVETNDFTPSLYDIKEKWHKAYYTLYVPENTVVTTFILN